MAGLVLLGNVPQQLAPLSVGGDDRLPTATLAGLLQGALCTEVEGVETGTRPGAGAGIDLDSDEFRRLSVTNEFVAAPHIYELDAG